MKRILTLLAVAALTASHANELANPGFETDAVLDAAPVAGATGWTVDAYAFTASSNTSPTRTGTGSLMLSGPGGFAGIPEAFQSFPASPGQTWNFRGYMLATNTLPADITFGLLKIVWLDASNNELSPVTINIGGAAPPENPGIESTPFLNNASGSNTWVFTEAEGIAPANTASVKLFALMVDQSAGTIFVDDLEATYTAVLPLNASITYPSNSATVWTNFTILADAAVAPASITNVDFYAGATWLGSDDTAPYKWEVTGQIPPGAAELKVIAQDDSGASVTSAVVNVTVQSEVVTNNMVVAPSQTWLGYMDRFDQQPNDWVRLEGGAWGVADLSAAFSGAGPASVLTLKPAPINDTNEYWFDYSVEPLWSQVFNGGATNFVGAVGFKTMQATMYVELPNAAGTLVQFSGTNISNTLDIRFNPGSTNLIGNGWTNYAFIKDLNPDYSEDVIVSVPLTNGQPFNLSLLTSTDPTRHVQYGFITRGPNVWPTDVDNYGSVVIAAPVDIINYPTNNAPAPTNAPGSVLSLYNSSGTYTDATNINFYPWGAATSVGNFNIPGGNPVKSYLGLNYYGVELNPSYAGGANIDVTAYDTLHVDVWTTANQLAIKLVSTVNGAAPLYIMDAASGLITSNNWVSLDIPLSAFTALAPTLDLANLDQLLWIDNGDIPGPGVKFGDFYIDNVYFYNSGVTPPVVTNSLVANWNFETNGATSTGLASWETAGSGGAIGTPVTIETADPYTGLQAVSIEGQGTGGAGAGPELYQNNIPVEPGTLTMSFYAKAAIKEGGANPQYRVSWRNAADAQIGVTGFSSFPSALNTNAYTLQTISGLTAPAGSHHCTITMLLAVGAGTGDHWRVLIDDLALVQDTVTPPVVNYPTNNAPAPTVAPSSVLSLYNSSGTYTDATNINFYPWGSAASVGNFNIPGGNPVKSYLGLAYYGVELNPSYAGGANIDVTAYDTLHVDVWTTANQLAIKLVSTVNGAAPLYIMDAASGLITSNNWVSLDIPLSAFTALAPTLDLANLDQLLWIDNGDIPGPGVKFGDFYIDNVYFYSTAVTPPTIVAPAISGGNFTLQVNSVNGTDYVLESTPSLAPAAWTPIQTNSGTGGTLNFSAPVGSGNEFFRVKTQ